MLMCFPMKQQIITLDIIQEIVGLQYIGKNEQIDGLNLCNRHTNSTSIISYVTSRSFFSAVHDNTNIKALFITHELWLEYQKTYPGDNLSVFITDVPETVFYLLHERLVADNSFYNRFSFDAVIGKNCNIHPTAIIEEGVVIKDNVTIGALSVIKKGCILENDVCVGSCSIIGSEGFQVIKFADGTLHTIIHTGGTHLMERVHIGDNTTIGNALFEGMCVVGKDTKIDNHVYIAHNCEIGEHVVITAGVIMLGSVTVGNNVWVAPNVLALNKVVISDNAFIGGMSLVTKNVPENTCVVGIPAKNWRRQK